MGPMTGAVVASLCCAISTAAAAAPPPPKAFPTAEGFGAGAAGGRGGRVIEVTTLGDSGAGSLRAAMEASGPRICVFRVSGTIVLHGPIRVSAPFLTVAGQTSPAGIEIRGDGNHEGDWGVWCVNGAHDFPREAAPALTTTLTIFSAEAGRFKGSVGPLSTLASRSGRICPQKRAGGGEEKTPRDRSPREKEVSDYVRSCGRTS